MTVNSPAKKPVPGRTRSSRAEGAASTRASVLGAALDLFTQHGFAATRMDDIAARAGVAKGTAYLHFEHKQALFEAIIRSTVVPALESVRAFQPELDEPTRVFAGRLLTTLWRRLRDGGGAQVIRLLIAEGPRFPRLAEAYYQSVVEPGLGLMRALAERAKSRGEPVADAARQFPLLVVMPALFGLLWGSLFERFEPLDVGAMIEAQLDLLFGPAEASPD